MHEERAYARALLLALKPFRDLKPNIPLSYVLTYLQVAAEEGRGVNDYAADAGIAASVMTRNLLDVGDRNRAREEGLGLITQERDLFDLRKHNAKITAKGRTRMREMMHAIRTALK